MSNHITSFTCRNFFILWRKIRNYGVYSLTDGFIFLAFFLYGLGANLMVSKAFPSLSLGHQNQWWHSIYAYFINIKGLCWRRSDGWDISKSFLKIIYWFIIFHSREEKELWLWEWNISLLSSIIGHHTQLKKNVINKGKWMLWCFFYQIDSKVDAIGI